MRLFLILSIIIVASLNTFAKPETNFSFVEIYQFKQDIFIPAHTNAFEFKDLTFNNEVDLEDHVGDKPDLSLIGLTECYISFTGKDYHTLISTEDKYVLISQGVNGSHYYNNHKYTEYTFMNLIDATNDNEEYQPEEINLRCSQQTFGTSKRKTTPKATLTKWFPKEVIKEYINVHDLEITPKAEAQMKNQLFKTSPVEDLSLITKRR